MKIDYDKTPETKPKDGEFIAYVAQTHSKIIDTGSYCKERDTVKHLSYDWGLPWSMVLAWRNPTIEE